MANLACGAYDYGIGLTLNTVKSLRLYGVPVPDQVIFNDAAIHYVRADFARVGDGYSSIQWIYDIISASACSKLLKFLGGAQSKELYIHSDKRDGTSPNAASAFNFYKATLWKPIITGEEGVTVVRSAISYQTVKFMFVNAEVQVIP